MIYGLGGKTTAIKSQFHAKILSSAVVLNVTAALYVVWFPCRVVDGLLKCPSAAQSSSLVDPVVPPMCPVRWNSLDHEIVGVPHEMELPHESFGKVDMNFVGHSRGQQVH